MRGLDLVFWDDVNVSSSNLQAFLKYCCFWLCVSPLDFVFYKRRPVELRSVGVVYKIPLVLIHKQCETLWFTEIWFISDSQVFFLRNPFFETSEHTVSEYFTNLKTVWKDLRSLPSCTCSIKYDWSYSTHNHLQLSLLSQKVSLWSLSRNSTVVSPNYQQLWFLLAFIILNTATISSSKLMNHLSLLLLFMPQHCSHKKIHSRYQPCQAFFHTPPSTSKI